MHSELRRCSQEHLARVGVQKLLSALRAGNAVRLRVDYRLPLEALFMIVFRQTFQSHSFQVRSNKPIENPNLYAWNKIQIKLPIPNLI